MKKFVMPMSLLLATALVGGCASLDKIQDASDNLADVASGKMSELEYYNLVIDKTNDIQDDLDSYGSDYDSYISFKDVSDENTCNYTAPILVETSYTDAKKELVDAQLAMEDADKQAKVEEQLFPFLEAYNELNTYALAFEDYCDREQYKDDDGAKITEYEDGLVTKLDDLAIQHSALLDTVEGFQDEVDLGIDENSTKPDEVAVLIQNELTDKVEAFYETAFTPYAQAVADGEEADFAPVKTAYDELVADIDTQEQRGQDVGLDTDTILSASFTNYIESVRGVTVEGEKLVRDQAAGSITSETIYDYDDSLLTAYNNVIDNHNYLVEALDSYVQL